MSKPRYEVLSMDMGTTYGAVCKPVGTIVIFVVFFSVVAMIMFDFSVSKLSNTTSRPGTENRQLDIAIILLLEIFTR